MVKNEKELVDFIFHQTNELQILNNYSIEIGVWDTSFNREKEDKEGKLFKPQVKVGVSNAQIMYIHEYGSKIKNLVPRPILEKTINWGQEQFEKYYLDKIVDGILNQGWTENDIENELKILAQEMESYCKEKTQHNEMDLAPLKPSTIANRRQHSDVPLYDTGQLVKSIRCQLTKK